MYPDSLKCLIESFKYLPGIGEKTAERLAFSILDLDDDQVDFFVDSLSDFKKSIHKCPICNTLTDNDKCYICADNTRENDVLCVVDDTKSVFLFEKLGMFDGKYHVLEGLINPLDGVNPEDIGIGGLLDRIKKENYKEILFAFKPSIEGDTTALYIKRVLEGLNIRITRLASGLPIGADMEYVDGLTLERAIKDRKDID